MAQPSDIVNPLDMNRQPAMAAAPLMMPNQDQAPEVPLMTPQAQDPMPSAGPAEVDLGGFDPSFLDAPDDPTGGFDIDSFFQDQQQMQDLYAQSEGMDISEESPGASALALAKASFGSTPESREAIFANHYGPDNVRVVGDTIHFRNPGEKKWHRVKSDTLDLLGELAGASRSVLEGATSALGALVGGAGGFAVGGPVGAWFGAGVGGGTGAGLGSEVADQLESNLSGGVSREFGVDSDQKNLDAALWAGGAELALGPVAGLAGAVIGKMNNLPLRRIGKEVADHGEFKSLLKGMGFTGDSEATVSAARGAAESAQNFLEKRIGLVKDEVFSLSDKQRFRPTETLKRMENLLQQEGGSSGLVFKNNRAMIEGPDGNLLEIGIRSADQAPGVDVYTSKSIVENPIVDGLLDSSGRQVAPKAPTPAYRFRAELTPELKKLATEYNRISAQSDILGGLTTKELDNMTQSFGRSFDGPAIDRYSSYQKNVYGGLSADRKRIFSQVLGAGDGQTSKTLNKAFTEYSENIDAVKKIYDEISNAADSGKGIDYLRTVVNPKDPSTIRALKKYSDFAMKDGAEHNLFDIVKREYVADLYLGNTKSELINGPEIMNKLHKLSPEVRDELFSPKEFAQLKHLAAKTSRYKGDLFGKDKAGFDALSQNPMLALSPGFWIGMLSKNRKNVAATDYILDGVLKSPLPKEKKQAVLDFAQNMVGYGPTVGKGLLPTKGAQAVGQLGVAGRQGVVSEVRSRQEPQEGRRQDGL